MISMKKVEIILAYLKIKKNKLCNFLFHRPAYTEAQKAVFNQLEVGDVIYARMPLPDRVMATIEKGHQNRPYLVVKIKEDGVRAYPCSHKKNYSFSYALKKENYPFFYAYGQRKITKSDTWISFQGTYAIPIGNIYYRSYHVNDYDLSEIERQLVIRKNQGRKNVHCLKYPYSIKKGDGILKDGKLYYVYQVDKMKLFTYRMKSANKKDKLLIKYKNGTFGIQIQEKEEIIWDENCRLFFQSDPSLIEKVEKAKENEKMAAKKIQKKCAKKKQNLKMLSFRYPSGTLLTHSFDDEIIIYLFNIGHVCYGLFCHEIDDGEYLLRQISLDNYYRKNGTLEQEELEEIIQNLLLYNGNFYGRECCELLLERKAMKKETVQ